MKYINIIIVILLLSSCKNIMKPSHNEMNDGQEESINLQDSINEINLFSYIENGNYKIIKENSQLLGITSKLLHFNDSNDTFLSVYVVNKQMVSNEFINEVKKSFFNLSCSRLLIFKELELYDFEDDSNYYIIKPCTECIALENNSCFYFTKLFLNGIKNNKRILRINP